MQPERSDPGGDSRRSSGPEIAPRLDLVARTLRGDHVEAWHFGAAAVMTPTGERVAYLGDPGTRVILRSASKPAQALPLLLAGGYEAFDLDAADLAVICASHAGRPEHVERVESLLGRGGFSAEDLLCGAHPPLDEEAAKAVRERGEEPAALHNNCSGKHAGMLLACRLEGFEPGTYTEPDHPLQQEIRAWMSDLSGLEPSRLATAVDGCGVPTFYIPLDNVARLYARFADPTGGGDGDADDEVEAALDRVVRSMTSVPEMVAGPGRFTTELMRATGGRVLGKEGADGLYTFAVRGPVALGGAVKIADGTEACRAGVVLDVLRQLGSLSSEEFGRLERFYAPPRKNASGLEIGRVQPDLELRA